MNKLINVIESEGRQLVSARELYLGLGYRPSDYSRWVKSNITENSFFLEDEDWVLLRTNAEYSSRGQRAQDYAITLSMAKKLSMMAKTKIGEQYRDYLLMCEREYKKLKPVLNENSTYIEKFQVSQMIMVTMFDALRISDSSKLECARKLCHSFGVPDNHLPETVKSNGVLHSLTELLKSNNISKSAIEVNKLLLSTGIIQKVSRKSSKGADKFFNNLTEKGLYYGENHTSEKSKGETQPKYYDDKFNELMIAIGLK